MSEMISVPSGWLYRINPDVPGSNWQFTQDAEHAESLARSENVEYVKLPADQHQGEPVAWRGINELGEVVTDWIDGVPPSSMVDLCGNPATFASIEKAYTHADPGEVERLVAANTEYARRHLEHQGDVERLRSELAQCEAMAAMIADREWAEHVGTGPVSSKVEAAFTQLHNDLHEPDEKLAERDALLAKSREICHAVVKIGGRKVGTLYSHAIALGHEIAALSDSAEPSAPNSFIACRVDETCGEAPVERDERADLEEYFAKVGLPMDVLPTGEYLIPATRFVSQGWHARAALERKS